MANILEQIRHHQAIRQAIEETRKPKKEPQKVEGDLPFGEIFKRVISDLIKEHLSKIEIHQGVDGKSPVKGKDYFTSQEQEAFISEIHKRLRGVIKGERGDVGPKGPMGYTPQKGTDYFTETDIKELIKAVTPIIIKSVIPMVTPKKGVHYFDGKDGKDGKIVSVEDVLKQLDGKKIVKLLRNLKGNDKLHIADINDPSKGKLDQRWHGGGIGINHFVIEDLSSQLNGVLKTFTIPSNRLIYDVRTSSAPFVYRPTTDYTGTGTTTLTFTSQIDASVSLRSGDSLIVLLIT